MLNDANVVPGGRSHIDARVLLLCVLMVLVASVATVHTLFSMLALFVFVLLWHAVVGRQPARTLQEVRRLLPFALVIVLINAVLVPGDPLLAVAGHRVLSAPGVRDGVLYALRLGVMLVAVSALVCAAPPESLACGVHSVMRRVAPRLADRVAFFVFLSMGFVPLFTDEIHRVRVAQSFRGGDMKGSMLRRAGSVRTWLVPVLMSAVRRSHELALAVELRHIRDRLVPSLPAPRMRASDVVHLVAVTAAVVAASRYAGGFH